LVLLCFLLGVLEPDAAQSIIGVVQNKSWSDFSSRVFVMLGAGAAMGPFLTLMAMGANVVAIDIDIPAVWERLLTVAQNSAGTFTFPLKKPQKVSFVSLHCVVCCRELMIFTSTTVVLLQFVCVDIICVFCVCVLFLKKGCLQDCATHKELAANAGANLIAQAPEIANWITTLHPKKQLVLGSYVYLDSAM
jgi:hypothetical protein